MQSILSFFGTLIQFAVLVLIGLAIMGLVGYNKLRGLTENVREAWSNIGVVGKKQISLINQLIDIVKGYQESEKLVMLKVSEDVSTAGALASLHQQSGMVLTAASGIAQKFPELKANQQYMRLIDSIQQCESQLEQVRQGYNSVVKEYNTRRSSIPHVFYAGTLGFNKAPYLEFQGNEQITDMGALKSFSADDDGDRLNALLGAAGNTALKIGSRAMANSRDLATKAIENSKVLVESAQEKVRQRSPGGYEDKVQDVDSRSEPVRSELPLLPPVPPPPTPEPMFHFLDANRNPTGPVTRSALRELQNQGAINADTLVVIQGGSEWIALKLIFTLE